MLMLLLLLLKSVVLCSVQKGMDASMIQVFVGGLLGGGVVQGGL